MKRRGNPTECREITYEVLAPHVRVVAVPLVASWCHRNQERYGQCSWHLACMQMSVIKSCFCFRLQME